MGSPLTPTVITDRNGRITTVHKKAEQGTSLGKSIPAPAIAPQVFGTPLELPPAMTPMQARKYISSLPKTGELVIRQHDVAKLNHETELPLLIKLLEEKTIPEEALRVVLKFSNDPGKITPSYHNTFLMAPFVNEMTDNRFVSGKVFKVMQAMNGWTEDRKPLHNISTKEELESYTALTRFAIAFEDDPNIIKYKGGWIEGNSISSIQILNKHLKKLVMEQPEDNDAIIQYVRERGGMHPKNMKPVKDIQVFLEGSREHTAVSSGWL